MTMRRRRLVEEIDDEDERSRLRTVRAPADGRSDSDEELSASATATSLPFGDALTALCGRFGLEPWASARDERGLWGFGEALQTWIERPAPERGTERDTQLEVVTNLLIIVGAAIRPSPETAVSGCQTALGAVTAARRTIAALAGPTASFPGAARAMQRLVNVRGWRKLAPPQQAVAEAMLDLYLETLCASVEAPDAETLLAVSHAWLTVLHLQSLPTGFDEHMLRSVSWYLESYLSSRC
jgi:hypothetical protein